MSAWTSSYSIDGSLIRAKISFSMSSPLLWFSVLNRYKADISKDYAIISTTTSDPVSYRNRVSQSSARFALCYKH